MKILVIGGGGREHAIVWKLKQSRRVSEIYCIPGNAGMAGIARCPDVDDSIESLVGWARNNAIDMTIVGPEAYLALGIADRFNQEGLAVFGPSKAAAEIESSKAFAKEFMRRHNIPTAGYKVFSQPEMAREYVREHGVPIVVKADGLAAGKGVTVARTVEAAIAAIDNIMIERSFGEAGETIVIEEYLQGEEASVLAFTDGDTVIPMVSAQDHKPAFDGDEGPNTGGMGAYSPAPVVTPAVAGKVLQEILIPAVNGLKQEGRPYKGVLYAGLMIDSGQPYVVEFNCRFGDPETQAILPRLKTDLVKIAEAVVEGTLDRFAGQVEWSDDACVCVILASGGYPGDYETGYRIEGLTEAGRLDEVLVFHAGTARENGEFVTDGGRVLGVTGTDRSLPQAIERTYAAVRRIHFQDMHFRKDIGRKALRVRR